MALFFANPPAKAEPSAIPPDDDVHNSEWVALDFLMVSNWMNSCPFNLGRAETERANISTATPIPTGSYIGSGPLLAKVGVLPIMEHSLTERFAAAACERMVVGARLHIASKFAQRSSIK